MLSKQNLQTQKEVINQRIENSLDEYIAVNAQIDGETDSVTRIRLKRKADDIKKELDRLHQELIELEKPQNNYRQAWNEWEDNLHHIDFDRAKKSTSTLLKKYETQEGAALFFFHNSQKMGGRWYIKFVRSELQKLPLSSWTEPFEYRSKNPPGGDPQVFLRLLAAKFAPEVELGSEDEQIRKIVDAIFKSLRRGHVFLISVSVEQVRAQDVFLKWLVDQFWCKIVEELAVVKQKEPFIRIIGVVSVEGKVNKPLIPSDLCCSIRQFTPQKMIELKLQNWTPKQISDWLKAYSDLDLADISDYAQNIYEVTDSGVPLLVYDKLATNVRNKN